MDGLFEELLPMLSVLVSVICWIFELFTISLFYKRGRLIMGTLDTFRMLMFSVIINVHVSIGWWFLVFPLYIIWECKGAQKQLRLGVPMLIRTVMTLIALVYLIITLCSGYFDTWNLFFFNEVDVDTLLEFLESE